MVGAQGINSVFMVLGIVAVIGASAETEMIEAGGRKPRLLGAATRLIAQMETDPGT
jgi:hypothetical protein